MSFASATHGIRTSPLFPTPWLASWRWMDRRWRPRQPPRRFLGNSFASESLLPSWGRLTLLVPHQPPAVAGRLQPFREVAHSLHLGAVVFAKEENPCGSRFCWLSLHSALF